MSKGARRALIGLAAAVLALGVLLAATMPFTPRLLRAIAISRIEALTGRSAGIEALDLDLRRGTLVVRGVRLADRDGGTLATIGAIDARIALRALLTGHLWIRDLAIRDSTVRVVRFEDGDVNIADLIRRNEGGGGAGLGAGLGVTVDRFSLAGGTVLLEDRSVSPIRVWKSENLSIVASNVSTRRDDGEAEASSTIDGAPVSVRVEQLRLRPVHLRAVVRARQVDLSLARIYVPANTPVLLDRGRLDTTITVALDAKTGVRVDADGDVADVLLVRREQGDEVLTAPAIRVAVRGFRAGNDGALAVGRVELEGATTLVNGDARPPARFDLPRVTLRADGLAWPVQGPARVELRSPVPGGGQVTVRGDVTPEPPSADVDVRLTRVNLAPWGRYLAPWLRVSGTGEIAMTLKAQLGPTLAASGSGVARLSRVVVADGDRRIAAVDRAEASGLHVQWPSRVTVERVHLRRPSGIVERDATGAIVVPGMTSRGDAVPREGAAAGTGTPGTERSAAGAQHRPRSGALTATPRPTVAVREIAIDDGSVTWRDLAAKPPTTLRLARMRVVTGEIAWPLDDAVTIQARAATPGGGTAEVSGRVGLDPMSADLQVKARGVALAPFAAYVPTRAPVDGSADADVTGTLVRGPELAIAARGRAAVSRLSVVDGKRRVLSAGRVEARGLDVDWPERVSVERLMLRQPWMLLERDEHGAFPLRAMLRPPPSRSAGTEPGRARRASTVHDGGRQAATSAARLRAVAASAAGAPALGGGTATPPPGDADEGRVPTVTVGEVVIEDGGARVNDRAVSPPYAEDLSRVWLRVRGLQTASDRPAKIDLRATVGQSGGVVARGAVAAFGESLSLDLTGETRNLAVNRLNPYLEHFVGWQATSGRLSTTIVCRLNAGDLRSTNEVRLGRLHVERAGRDDEARRRIGLPLGLIVGLLKDRQGDIRLSLPIGGNLDQGGLDFSDAVWSAVRAVAIRTMALPVSWIGRLRFSADSKIEDIEIDPVEFEAGTATLAVTSAPRLERITAFMRDTADVKMVLTPVISLGDIEALKTRAITARITALAGDRKGEAIEAARALHAEKVGGPPPEDLDAIVAALREVEEPPAREAAELARARAEAVREALAKADIVSARLTVNKEPAALDTLEAGRVEFGLTDQVKPRRSLADLLRALVEAVQRRLAAIRDR